MKNIILFLLLMGWISSYISGQTTINPVDTLKEIMPTFPGGTEEMYRYVYNNLHYPDEARRNKISGQVIVQFVVGTEGAIRNVVVKRNVGYGCDEEAVRIIESMNDGYKWTPGQHKGHPAAVTFTLPIKFVLQ